MSDDVFKRIVERVQQRLKLPVPVDGGHNQHIAGILLEEPPINGNELYELIADFIDLFRIDRNECTKRCDELYNDLKSIQVGEQDNKFKLSAGKLDSVVVLENVLSMDDARIPLFAKKPTGGNSNTEMSKWKKKEKGKDKDTEKALMVFEKHLKEIEDKKKELPPVQIRRDRQLVGGKNNDLILENISLTIAGKTLLEGANLKLAFGRKYGLVGRNGIGKTCLMNALARGEFPKMPTHLQILLVQQQIRDTSKSVMSTVLETDVEREALLIEQVKLSESDADIGAATKRLNEIYKRLDEIEAHKAEAKAATILGGLGFTQEMLQKKVGELSGGWRMRVALARALFVEPDVLLLDEPTNHLDLDAVMWLQDYVCNCKNTVVIVSHAREFLNVTCNQIMHYHSDTLQYYKGNYDTFQKLRIENRERGKKGFETQQMKLEHMQAFIDKFRYNAKRASLVQSRIKAINKMELVEEVIEDPTCVFIFPTPDKLRPPLLRIEDGYFSYHEDPTKPNILRNVNFAIDMESRIAIVGANGVGKSTLLKLLVGSLALTSGNSYRNSRLGLSMFTQHHIDQLKLPLSPLEQFMTDFPGSTQQTYRSHLGSFGVTGMLALRPNYLLSGGQKSRVAFALAMWRNPHILVLDEPTNHLDIDAVNALIIALNNYSGGVIIVSHDQHLISTVCDQIWYLKDTRLKKFTGDFEDYRRQLAQGKLE